MTTFDIRRQRLEDRERAAKAALQSLQANPSFLHAVESGEPLPKTLREQMAEHETTLARIPLARAQLEQQESAHATKAAAAAEKKAVARLEELGGLAACCADEFMSAWRALWAKYQALEEAAQAVRDHARLSGFRRESWYRLESAKLREQVLLVIGYALRFDWKLLEGAMRLSDIAYMEKPPTLDLRDAWADYLNDGTRSLRIEVEPPEAA